MAVLQAISHTGRITAGNTVIERAKTTDTKAVKARLASFTRAHAALVKAQSEVDAFEAEGEAILVLIVDADADQDTAVEGIADARVADGQLRSQPFKGLGVGSPSDVRRTPYAAEAKLIGKLSTALRKRKLSVATKGALVAAEKAAAAVLKFIKLNEKNQEKLSAARDRRDALALPWQSTFSALKRAARTAEDDGATGLFDALFSDTDKPAAKKPRKAKPAAPATEPTPVA